jgi:hypothetical protein
MKNNIHPAERVLRVGVGVFLMSLAYWGPTNYWYLLGIIPVMTGLSGYCPLYAMMGVSTCKANDTNTPHLSA